MNTIIKNIVARTYKPVLEKYLSKKRIYKYKDIRLEIPPEVFHPGFFSSSLLLLEYILKLQLKEKSLLELGAGSGLLSMVASKKKAYVTATDINPIAIEYLETNSHQNDLQVEIIHSNLFDNIPGQYFDIIAINPPYYKRDPHTPTDHAWYCGGNGEYFIKLFQQLPGFIYNTSEVIMVLCDGCDIDMITRSAAQNGLQMNCMMTRQTIIEKNLIFKIEKIN